MKICGSILATVSVAAFAMSAEAHDAPTGWSYDLTCCSSMDCREISSKSLEERPGGYFITIGNVTLPYGDRRLRDSPDGQVHWCTANGRDDGRTICLYVPPRSY